MIKRIIIKDFLSIEDASLDLSRHRLCVVDGFNKDEGGKSNGSGKTAFLEAIRWAVLGDPGINRDTPIRHGAEAATVTLELDFRGHTYTLKRVRKKREIFDFWIDEACMTEGLTATEAQKKFEDYFDIDPEVFLTLFVVDGNTIQSFCNYTSSERIAIVNKYFRNNRWETYLDRASAEVERIEKEIQFVSAARDADARAILSVEEQDRIFNEVIQKRTALEQEYYPFRKALTEYLKEKDRYRAEVEAYHQYVSRVGSIQDRIKEIEGEIKTLSVSLSSVKAAVESLSSSKESLKKITELIELDEERSKKLLTQIRELGSEITTLNKDLGKITEYVRILEFSKVSKQCEICGGKIASVTEKIKGKKAEQASIEAKISELRADVSDLERQFIGARDHVSDLSKQKDQLVSHIREMEDKQRTVVDLNKRIQDLRAQLAKNTEALDQCQQNPVSNPVEKGVTKPLEFRGKIYDMDELNREIEVLVSDLRAYEDRISRSESARKRIIQHDSKLSTLNAKLEIYRFWEKAFGKYGIPIRVLDNLLPLVQEKTNQYLGELNSVFRIALETRVPRKREDGFKEKMEILIKNMVTGSNFTLRSNSRGEVKAIATMLFLAFNSIVRDREGFDFNVLLLDEVFDGLDRVSRGMVFSLVSRLTGFQILATSHYQDVNDKFHSKLLCTKERGATMVTEVQ